MREIIISLLSLALFLLKVSAKLSDVPFYLPANETLGLKLIRERNTSDLAQSLLAQSRCGWPGGGRSCPTGQCCDFDGWCGTGDAYCDEDECDFQCPGPIPVGRCGMQAGGRPCPTGQCCRDSGWCGTTEEYCNPLRCQSQCSGPYPSGRCGWQAGGRKCPTGLCCSLWGWCGTTSIYCSREECQSQCERPPPPPSPPPPPPPPPFPQGRCGKQAAGRACPTGVCCSIWGWCGTTRNYCVSPYCQSQCKGGLTSYNKNRFRGIESLLLNAL
ncbi:putative galactoside 2-alpha-L-fucosyltransferase-like [Capsicum annuum]|uniref:chitin-binding lectin 1 n=1 Tax=Capsicum annuum TaxID=4072 RepID=UPI001FB096F2|nr:chitin-binding lectin 1 [Capsicum annuum]KAF3658427.1 putative galactoside 2-alpha-L-fucosyltransferase-like [Capsicum annuum]KAF3661093.1 putative galactoside 2-alpha-L-fucosyltransferase-like [Capsicum annuum]